MPELEMTLADLIELIEELSGEDECRYDCNGKCQTHLWFHETECPHKRAKDLLCAIGENKFTLDINL
jgi:hypothetical protein